MQPMDQKNIGKVEEIIRGNLSRIIKISYAIGIKNYTSPGYVILYHVNQPEKKLVSPNGHYIKICSMLDSERIPIGGIALSKINIKDIDWIEVLDYSVFHKDSPLSDIVEVCLENKWNKSDITGLFTLDDKENTEKSLRKIKKMTKSKYPSFKFYCPNDLVVLKKFS